jgi:hypothetical protein
VDSISSIVLRFQDAMIDAMIRLEKALKPYIAKLQL